MSPQFILNRMKDSITINALAHLFQNVKSLLVKGGGEENKIDIQVTKDLRSSFIFSEFRCYQ